MARDLRFGSMINMLGWTLLPAFASGQSASTVGSAAPPAKADEPLAEVRVLGSRERLNAMPGAGDILDAEVLQRSRVLTVNEALRKVPGVFVREEEGLGMRPNIGVRGLNPTRSTKVLLLEDGLPLTFAPYGDNATYYHPPIERFERVEVLKGSSQIRFGPQTIGGVINYLTARPPEEFAGRVNLRGGNRGLRDLQLQVGDRIGATDTGWLINAIRKQSDGSRENIALKLEDVALRLEKPLGASRSLAVRASLYREDSQVPYSGLTLAEWQADRRANPFVNDRFEVDRWAVSTTLGQRLDNAGELNASLYYTYLNRDWWRQSSNSGQRPNDASDPLCGGMANLLTTCGNEGRLRQYYTAGADVRYRRPFAAAGSEGSFSGGARWHIEKQYRVQVNGDTPNARTPGTSVNGGVRENNRRDVAAASAFIEAEIGAGRWRLQPGIRFESIEFERRNFLPGGGAGRARLSEWIPGIGATLELPRGLTLFAGVHRGFAPPRVEDIITAAGSSVDLDAERSWNTEIGLRATVRPGWRWELTAFDMDFSNQIVPASVAGGTGATLTSAGRTAHRGLELAAQFESDEALGTAWNAYSRAALTWLPLAEYRGRRLSSIAPTVSVTGNRLPYAPKALGTLAIGVETPAGFSAELEAIYSGSVFTDDLNTVAITANGQRGRIGGYAVFNLTVAKTVGANVTLYGSAKNLTDKLYIADLTRGLIPGPPRQVQVGIDYRF
ncbi:MAG: TonB-dependent receptor [Steroidobacteraceae bacterium]|nr:TonB-dependent receptor [Steroidobacteraceae bacterium]MDW8258688.1 TonB-dependent receptor [Gammaproteobacteria bacterium]